MINSQLGPGESESAGLGLTNVCLHFKASLCWKRISGTDEFLRATLGARRTFYSLIPAFAAVDGFEGACVE